MKVESLPFRVECGLDAFICGVICVEIYVECFKIFYLALMIKYCVFAWFAVALLLIIIIVIISAIKLYYYYYY